MNFGYDECLQENPFFREIQDNHTDVIEKATEEGWIVCVPRINTIDSTVINEDSILEHIVVPNRELPCTHFYTLTKRVVIVKDKVITIGGDRIAILFDETFYVNKTRKYKVWCIERPLCRNYVTNCSGYMDVRNLPDCIHLLQNDLNEINKVIEEFLCGSWEFDNLDVLKEKVSTLYQNCVKVTNCNSYNINVVVEMYMQHCIHHKLFRALCNWTAELDANFNKIHRNALNINLKDLDINEMFFEGIVNAKHELANINTFSTCLGKIECLKRTVDIINCKNKTEPTYITTVDDLLKIFVFLIAKSNLNSWIANLMYLTHFRFSSINLSDENSFLITTLEAAIEYIKNNKLCVTKVNDAECPLVINSLSTFFCCIENGDLTAIKKVFSNKLKSLIVDKISLCHPLCSCEKCIKASSLSINSCDDKGRTALHIACLSGQPHVVDYLISKGIDVDAVDYFELTPLHYSASKGHQNALLLLLHTGAHLEPKDCDGNTPIHLAANNGHENCVKALLYFSEQKGHIINVNCKNNIGDTPLHFAAKWGYAGVTHILLQYGARIDIKNKCNRTALTAAHNDHLRNLMSNFFEPLPCAAEEIIISVDNVRHQNMQHMKRIDLALKSIENNDLPLMCHYLGIPNSVVTKDVDTKSVCHPLCTCDDCLKQFDSSVSQNSNKAEVCNINACNSEGYTALHVAAKYGRVDILRLLLDCGAAVNMQTYELHQTPLHLACKNQRIQIVRELLKCGGYDLDVQDVYGNTALHYACLSNNSKLVELLLRHGCSCNIKNYERKTPADEAHNQMLYSIVALLRDKSDNSNSSVIISNISLI